MAGTGLDEDEAFALLRQLEPEQLLTVGLPVWWLMLLPGKPANLCLEGGFLLAEAFALFAIAAEVKAAEVKLVELIVHDERTGRATKYGRADPYFDGDRFVGARRAVAAGLEAVHRPQRPAVPAGTGGVLDADQPAHRRDGGHHLGSATVRGTPREPDAGVHPRRRRGPARDHRRSKLAKHPDETHRGAVNVASDLPAVLRVVPELRERALASPHRRLPELLRAIGDAELINDDDSNHRFALPGHPGGVYLDEPAITAPDLGSGGLAGACRRTKDVEHRQARSVWSNWPRTTTGFLGQSTTPRAHDHGQRDRGSLAR